MTPSTVALASRYCLRALDHAERGEPYDRSQFACGVAAHAVLQALGEATKATGGMTPHEERKVADAVAERLIRDGRSYRGRPEPPLPPAPVFEGVRLALDFIAVYPLSTAAHYEIGLAADEDWRPVEFGRAPYSAILDYACSELEVWEESAPRVLAVRDYKTAWPTGPAWLSGVQAKMQACLALACLPEGKAFDVLRLEVVNLRTLRVYSDTYDFHDLHHHIEIWRRELAVLRQATAKLESGERPASPGPNCSGCPYLQRCEPAQDYLRLTVTPPTAWERGIAWSVAVAQQEAMRKLLEVDAAEEPIDLGDGRILGFLPQPIRRPLDDAYAKVWEAWEGAGGEVRGLLRRLNLTSTQLDSVARKLYPRDRDAQEAWLEPLKRTENRARFSVQWIRDETTEEDTE